MKLQLFIWVQRRLQSGIFVIVPRIAIVHLHIIQYYFAMILMYPPLNGKVKCIKTY